MAEREIKFRGRSITSGKWVYGTFSKLSNGEALIFSPDPENKKKLFYDKVDPDTVGQFTGIELNGREVYEDDIIYVEIPASDVADVPLGYGIYYAGNQVVRYDDEKGRFEPFHEFEGYCEKVVGNIHNKMIVVDDKLYSVEPNKEHSECCQLCTLKSDKCRSECEIFDDENTFHHLKYFSEL